MDKSVFVSILVGVVTLAFSYLIYRIQKIRRYPGCLSFTIKDFFRVMRNAPGNYKNLSLTYENYQVKDNLLYIKFCIFNNQSFDCSCPNNTQPIVIEVPEGVKWIDTKISKQSIGVESESTIKSDRELAIHFNLLRDKEFVIIEGLLESSIDLDQEELQEKISIKHRIPNFGNVQKISVLSLSGIKSAKRRLRTPLFYFAFMMILFIVMSLFKETTNPLKFIDKTSSVERALFINEKNEIVYLKSQFPWARYSTPITQEEFLQNYSPVLEYHSKTDTSLYVVYVLYGILLVFLTVLVITELTSINRTKIVDKIINQ